MSVSVESTYDWEAKESSIPINFVVSQLLKVGKRPVQLSGGVKYWADSAGDGPECRGTRLQWMSLLPR